MTPKSKQRSKKPISNNDLQNVETENKSILLSVPMYVYIEFIKMYQTPILFYIAGLVGILLGYIYVPSSIIEIPPILPHDLSLESLDPKKSDSTYIQAYNSLIYERMLKELRQMQQATINLQMMQQATERKTYALQRTLHTLKTSMCENAVNLNDENTKNLIKDALLLYDADKLGLRDYALESLGGYIISTPNTIPRKFQTRYILFGVIALQSYSNPREVIQADVMPGKCFSFEGEQGKVRIKLSNDIFISAVTLEHPAISLLTAEEISSAPQHFQIKGLTSEYGDNDGVTLGQFSYSVDGPPRQTFLISSETELKPFQFIELHILNNHGNIDYTCVYRLRVHGQINN